MSTIFVSDDDIIFLNCNVPGWRRNFLFQFCATLDKWRIFAEYHQKGKHATKRLAANLPREFSEMRVETCFFRRVIDETVSSSS